VHPKDRDIAMVFQNYALYPHMTVYKNMAFALMLRKTPKPEIERRVRAAAKLLGIEELLDRKPRQLSGGQRQRVAVGRAIVREPKAFLFDEPLSNLDAKLRVTTRAELKALHLRLKTTTIYVTHDQEEAMTLGDRVVVMSGGEVQQVGTPMEVYQQPANRFVAAFVGTPPMNLFEGTLKEAPGGTGVWFDEGSEDPTGERNVLMVPKPMLPALKNHIGKPVVMGIRPQALQLFEYGKGEEESTPDGLYLRVRIRVIEPLGDSFDLIFGTEANPHLVARIPTRFGLKLPTPQSVMRMVFSMDQAHFFEPGPMGKNLLLVR
jgi:multiple sugar transport system ATP-binding protein